MSQVVYVRLPEGQVVELDNLVNKKLYSNRSAIIQEAVADWLFRRGYIHIKNQVQNSENSDCKDKSST